jgi:hypothetical protein
VLQRLSIYQPNRLPSIKALRGLNDMSLVMPDQDLATLGRRAGIVAAMRLIVPNDNVIDDEASLRAYESDGLTAYRQPPLVVVLPETTAQVSAVLAWCYANCRSLTGCDSGWASSTRSST